MDDLALIDAALQTSSKNERARHLMVQEGSQLALLEMSRKYIVGFDTPEAALQSLSEPERKPR